MGAQRNGTMSQLDEFAAVDKAEEGMQDTRPPDRSLEALGQMCALFHVPGRVLYRVDPADESSYRKIEITLEE